MSRHDRRLDEALKAAGAVLRRSKKHLVYGLPNGKTVVIANSPGDRRATDNALTILRRLARSA